MKGTTIYSKLLENVTITTTKDDVNSSVTVCAIDGKNASFYWIKKRSGMKWS